MGRSFPAEGAKSIDLNVGVFNGDADPTVYSLSFEDAASREQRLAYDDQIEADIDRQSAAQSRLPAGTEKTDLETQLAARENERDQRATIERGLMSDLLSKSSVQQSLPTLLLSILGALKQTKWPDLDMALWSNSD